ncbi:hypothetical protein ACVXG7_11940 [Enterobacter hormaechei]
MVQCAWSADHSILCAAYGRQRDDEAGGMGAVFVTFRGRLSIWTAWRSSSGFTWCWV